MSSKSTGKKYQKIAIQDSIEPLKLKTVIIPYSNFSKTEKFIYYGHEKIPFHERHPVYQTLLKKEFADGIKMFLINFKT